MRLHVLWRILAAQALSSLGTSMSTIALGFMVLQLTGSVLHMGAVMAVSVFPLVVTSWIGGAVLDRYNSKQVMIASDAARAVLIFFMPFLAEQAVGLIYAVSFFMGVGSAFFNPGQIKLIGDLCSREHLVRANSYLSVSRDGAELIGFLAGGVLVAAVGYRPAFFVDAGSYLLSGLFLLGLPRVARGTGRTESVRALVAESPAVFMRMWRNPALRTNLLMAVFPLMFVMMSSPNAYALVMQVFDGGALELGVMEVIVGAGLITGGLIMSRTRLTGDKNAYVAFSYVVVAICFAAVFFSNNLWVSIVLVGVAGVANVGMFVPSITMFQEAAAEGDKGRLIAVRAGFGQMGSAAGYLLGGILGAALGIQRLFLVAGLAAVGLIVIIYVPYHIGTRRRARAAFTQAMQNGARRVEAREAARRATMQQVPVTPSGREAWTIAAEEAALEEQQ